MEKFLENLTTAEKTIRAADHMIYVTFPLIKDKRLLFKILHETKNAIALCINSILQYEYLYKRIKLYKDSGLNFKIFVEKCVPRYGITKEEMNLILELFDFVEKHKESPFEFVKDEKIVILSSSLRPRTITIEKIKEFMTVAKSIFKKTRETIK
ncbi:hypothetical protein J4422_02625 [Candidatus Pacearchaeota archaeon]|nr:hypothetical protein [Candidatus Pacearchaeota archaeon]